MTETRRQVFKTSVLSAFGLMATAMVARASGIGAEYVVVRATDSKNHKRDLLLRVRPDQIKAFDIKGITPVPSSQFDISDVLLESKQYSLVPVGTETFKVVGSSTQMMVTLGVVSSDDFSKLAKPGWNEIGGVKSPPPPPPPLKP